MSEIKSLFRKSGIAGVGVGFASGLLFDKIAEYVYVNFVPAEYKVSTPLFAPDDWVVFAIGVLMIFSGREEVGLGWLLGFLIGSGWLK